MQSEAGYHRRSHRSRNQLPSHSGVEQYSRWYLRIARIVVSRDKEGYVGTFIFKLPIVSFEIVRSGVFLRNPGFLGS